MVDTVGPVSGVERHIIVGTKDEMLFIRKDREVVWFDLSAQMIEELVYKTKKLHGRIIIAQ